MNRFMPAAMLAIGTVCSVGLAQEAPPIEADTPSPEATAPAPEAPSIFPMVDYTGGFWERARTTGDWGGARTRLADKGMRLHLDVNHVFQDIVDGGKDLNSEYGARLSLTLELDSGRMGLWPGGFLEVKAEQFVGDSVLGSTGTLAPVNTSALFPAPGDEDLALPVFQFTQFLAPNLAVSLGKLDIIGGDMNAFAHGAGDEQFFNTAFSFNLVSALTVPYTPLGAAILYIPNEKVMVNFSAVDSEGSAMTSGFDTVFHGGTSFTAETRITTNFFEKPGHQLVGVVYSSHDYTALEDVVDISIPRLMGRFTSKGDEMREFRPIQRLLGLRFPVLTSVIRTWGDNHRGSGRDDFWDRFVHKLRRQL